MGNNLVNQVPMTVDENELTIGDKTRDMNNNISIEQSTEKVSAEPLSEEQLRLMVNSLGMLFAKANEVKAHKRDSPRSPSAHMQNRSKLEAANLSEPNTRFLENLTQMLGTQIEDYLTASKEARLVPATTYHSATSLFQPYEAQSKTIYNNYFSKPVGIENYFTSMINGEPIDTNSPSSRRESFSRLSENNQRATSHDVPHSTDNNTNESIRINLPEILDQNDEITILRLLIKLLSNKINHLSNEKMQLLEHISELNQINIEMSRIVKNASK